ncbi:MAG: transglutaminase-like cysteine peptidase [Pseudomonadota bacterium]
MPLHTRLLLTLGLLFAGATGVAAGETRTAALTPGGGGISVQQPAHLNAIGGTTPPIGYVRFCADHGSDCVAAGDVVFEMQMDKSRFSQLEKVNASINEAVDPVTDLEHFGETERWSYPTDGKGDCEDYVLAKRKSLMALGWPASVLLITVVRDKDGDGHAVLTVVTDHGDLILDNQAPHILSWKDTGYRFVKRQSHGDPALWVALGEGRSPPVVGGGR